MSALAPACADYQGEVLDRVVRASEVEVREELPAGYRSIGVVEAEEENTINGNDPVEYATSCEIDARLLRRMKRVAARNGGELLVAVICEFEETENTSPQLDDPETWLVETELTCLTSCSAEVARRADRDG